MSKRKAETEPQIEVEMDPTTGMPLLPPDQFWRVDADSVGDIRVHWMRRSFFGREYRLNYEYVLGSWNEYKNKRDQPTKQHIVNAAIEMVRERDARNARKAALEAITGDYPPKSMR
jgi:hypothetical protein